MIRVVEARIFIAQKGTFWVSTLKRSDGGSRTIRIGAPDPTLTGSAGLLAVAELADRLGLIKELDVAAGTGFKERRRGCSAGEFLTAMAALNSQELIIWSVSITGAPTSSPKRSGPTRHRRRRRSRRWPVGSMNRLGNS